LRLSPTQDQLQREILEEIGQAKAELKIIDKALPVERLDRIIELLGKISDFTLIEAEILQLEAVA
jgi:hypothetical protein